jgi:hypothetical protein
MAVQLHVAHSSLFQGVGVFAGGPYHCAQGELAYAITTCLEGLPPVSVSSLVETATIRSDFMQIDSTSNLANQRIFLYTGLFDSIVAHSVVESTGSFYSSFAPNSERIILESSVPSGHTMPTIISNPFFSQCTATSSPYISNCAYDGAGRALQHIYNGTLKAPNNSTSLGQLIQFSQVPFTLDQNPSGISFADNGYVYVPPGCSSTSETCRLHVVLHGCEQTIADIGELYVTSTGYNSWADANNFIVLYPQAVRNLLIGNENGCFDWWGYLGNSGSYDTIGGYQIAAIYAMMQAIEKGTLGQAKPIDALPSHCFVN